MSRLLRTPRKRLALVLFSVLLIAAIYTFQVQRQPSPTASASQRPTLVIDAGHGGIDGGAVSADGRKESEINLSIALKLNLLAEFTGYRCVMTRIDDSFRTDASSYSEHEDLVYRTGIINSVSNAVLMSIHQNCYPAPQPWGAQVLYSTYPGSEMFGKITQENIVKCLQTENRRVAEPASKELFITANAKCPSVLVECGFMSNSEDVKKLTNENYQTALSVVLICSYLQFISEESVV